MNNYNDRANAYFIAIECLQDAKIPIFLDYSLPLETLDMIVQIAGSSMLCSTKTMVIKRLIACYYYEQLKHTSDDGKRPVDVLIDDSNVQYVVPVVESMLS
jgi:hypothetical protein